MQQHANNVTLDKNSFINYILSRYSDGIRDYYAADRAQMLAFFRDPDVQSALMIVTPSAGSLDAFGLPSATQEMWQTLRVIQHDSKDPILERFVVALMPEAIDKIDYKYFVMDMLRIKTTSFIPPILSGLGYLAEKIGIYRVTNLLDEHPDARQFADIKIEQKEALASIKILTERASECYKTRIIQKQLMM